MIDAGEEYYSRIENQSERVGFGTKLVQPLGSTLTQQIQYLLRMIDAGEEYYSRIENQSERVGFGTKLVQPLGSTMTVC